jgi:DinB superfamily
MKSVSFRFAAVAFASVLPMYALAAQGQASAATNSANGLTALTQNVTRTENNILSLAEAMPADKYDFAPSSEIFKPGSPAEFATVHTFAQQVTHISGLPYRLYAAFGVKPDAEVDVKALDSLKSKDEIIKALKASFEYHNKVIASFTPENILAPEGPRNMTRIAAMALVLGDYGDHYGQMVEYGRMNGIIPPATANQMRRMAPAPAQR